MKTLILLVGLTSLSAWGFPDTIRHGYTNCTTCHVSPAGGGLTNAYGRSLSRELISTWGVKNEEAPLHGLVSLPDSTVETFFLGGDVRHLTTSKKNQGKTEENRFLMQAQLRLGVAIDKIKFLMSVGKIENPTQSENVKLVSPEYYVLWNPQEQIHMRAGRFEPVYGLRMPDHNLWVKSQVGLVPWNERDGAEFMFESENQFVSLAGFQSTSKVMAQQQVTGFTASFYQTLAEKHRLGISAMNTEGQGQRTKSLTFSSALTFSERTYGLFEYTRTSVATNSQDVGFLRLGWEVAKGVVPILQGQSRAFRDRPSNDRYRSGAGLIWYPRPHWELMGLVESEKGVKGHTTTHNMLMLHYYL